MPDPFEGERVRLRATVEDDFDAFHRWWSDPDTLTFQTTGPLTFRSREADEEMFRSWMKDTGNALGFSIERVEDAVLVGQCSLWGITPTERCATLGVIFGREYWNQGYGTEALGLVLTYVFNERNLHRVQLTVNANNPRAIRAYEKVGFRQEGTAREAFYRDGMWQDNVYMGVLKKEVVKS